MTAAVVGTVSVQPVTSRNSAIAAVPAKNFLTKKDACGRYEGAYCY